MIYLKEGDTSFRYQVKIAPCGQNHAWRRRTRTLTKPLGERNLNIDRTDESESDIGDNPGTRGFVREKRGPRSQHAW